MHINYVNPVGQMDTDDAISLFKKFLNKRKNVIIDDVRDYELELGKNFLYFLRYGKLKADKNILPYVEYSNQIQVCGLFTQLLYTAQYLLNRNKIDEFILTDAELRSLIGYVHTVYVDVRDINVNGWLNVRIFEMGELARHVRSRYVEYYDFEL